MMHYQIPIIKREGGKGMKKPQLKKKGLWKPEEDMILKRYVEAHGEGNWATISKTTGLMRGGKSCRLRWKNYLRPNIKHGSMSQEEEDLIIRLHKLLGNRWSLIAGRLPGRTDNEVKNYWNTHLNKKINHRQAVKKKLPTNFNNDNDVRSNTEKQRQSQKDDFQPSYQQPASTSERRSTATTTATTTSAAAAPAIPADGHRTNHQEYYQNAFCCRNHEMMTSFPMPLQPIKEADGMSMAFMCNDHHDESTLMPTLRDGGFLSGAFGSSDWVEAYMHDLDTMLLHMS
ncbi:hypothetical protein Ancab_006850 [Ancistrocladus abbreviatus]